MTHQADCLAPSHAVPCTCDDDPIKIVQDAQVVSRLPFDWVSTKMPLRWVTNEKRFEYMSQADSTWMILARARELTRVEANDLVVKLLERLAAASRAAHCASTY